MYKQFAQPFLRRLFDGICRLYVLGVISGFLLLVLSFLSDLIAVQLYPLKGQFPAIVLFLIAQTHRIFLSFYPSFMLMVAGIVLILIQALVCCGNTGCFQRGHSSPPAELWNRALLAVSKVLLDVIKVGLVIFIGFLVMMPLFIYNNKALLTSLQGSLLLHFPFNWLALLVLILMIFIASLILRRLIDFRNALSVSGDAAHVAPIIGERSQKYRGAGALSRGLVLFCWALIAWYLQTVLITLSGLIVIVWFLRLGCQGDVNA